MAERPPVCPVCEGLDATCPIAAEWGDEERMTYMFSVGDVPSPQQIEFWAKAVQHLTAWSESFTVDPEKVREHLRYKGCVPLHLDEVFAAMLKDTELIPRDDLAAEESSWAWWIASKLVGLVWSRGGKQLVSRRSLEAASEQLSQYCMGLPEIDRTYVMTARCRGEECSFRSLCKHAGLADSLEQDDCELLASWLVKGGHAVRSSELIKISQGSSISEMDRNTARLRAAVGQLQEMVDKLTKRAHAARTDAVTCHRSGQEKVAVMHMRRLKTIRGTLERRVGSLLQLENCLNKVESLQCDKMVLEASAAAARAMADFTREHNLTVDHVDDVISAVAKEMEEADEVSSAMASLADLGLSDMSKEDLEKEMALLEEEEHAEAEDAAMSAVLKSQQQNGAIDVTGANLLAITAEALAPAPQKKAQAFPPQLRVHITEPKIVEVCHSPNKKTHLARTLSQPD
ncbi:unnamed protein product [Chrysoparadoxa australica]